MKAKNAIILMLFIRLNSYAQLNSIEHHVVNFENRGIPELKIVMYYAKTAGGIGQSYWITLQNLTSKHLHVRGKYFANLKCGNLSTADLNIEIKPNEKAVP